MNKLQKIIVTILIVLSFSACGQGNTQRERSVEEPAVYSALINDQLGVDFSYLMGDPIIIINSSDYETIEDDYLLSELKSVDKSTLEDFKTVNQISQPLGMPLSVNKAYEYVAWPTDENGWAEFQQKYPNAISITTLSNIGFNKRLDQALVFMAYYCGMECGSANIYFLVREGDTWKVEGSVNVWVS